MRALLDDAAILHDVNEVSSHGRREPVGDNHGRSLRHEFLELVEPPIFRPGIH